MKWITFSFQKSYFYFIIYWISTTLFSLVTMLNNESQDNSRLNLINTVGGDLLAGFLVLYTYFNTKKETSSEKENKKNKNQIELIYNDPGKRRHKHLLILIISIIEFIVNFPFFVFNENDQNFDYGGPQWMTFLIILSRIFFSYKLMKINLYKHHYVSLISILVGYSIMGILAIIAKDLDSGSWGYYICIAVKYILNGLEDVLNKILLTNKFLLPHSLMFWRGLYNLLMLIIVFICIIIFSGIKENDKSPQITFFFGMIFSSFKSFINMKVIDIFTPHHLIILNILYQISNSIFYRISKNENDNLGLLITCETINSVLIIFPTLIFSEIIIINKWGLNENTKKGLLDKEKYEFDDDETRNTVLMDEKEDKEKENVEMPDEKEKFTSN